MDALSHALSNVRLTSPLLALLHVGQDVAIALGDGTPPPDACPFHYVISGSLTVVARHFEVQLNAGDMLLLPHWPEYRLETGAPKKHTSIDDLLASNRQPYWSPQAGLDSSLVLSEGEPPVVATLLGGIFAFDRPQAASLLDDLPDHLLITGLDSIEGILNAVLAFVVDEKAQRPGYAATAARLLEALLIETLRSWTLFTAHGPGRLRGMVDARLTRALHAIHSNPGYGWKLEDLAEIAGQSRSNFAAHFRRTVGSTPAAYIREWRCQIAEHHLRGTDSIAKIAKDLGYASGFAFSRAFMQERQITPARFRRGLRDVTAPNPL